MPPIANYFLQRRLELRLTRLQICKRLGLATQKTIRGWERYENIPRAGKATVKLLAEAYQDTKEHIEQALIEQRRALDQIGDENNKNLSKLETKIGKFSNSSP